jgi:hypothetical protein
VTLGILDPALAAEGCFLRLGQDARAGRTRSLGDGLYVVDCEPDAVDDPRNVVIPATTRFARAGGAD